MPNYIPHSEPPVLTAGSISFVAEHAHAAVEYRLTPGAGGDAPTLVDLHDAEVVDGWDDWSDLEDLLSPVVYPDLASYRARRGWPLGAVLVAAGVPAEVISDELDDLDADEHWTEDRGRYNFAVAPPGYELRPLTPQDVSPAVAALAGADGRIGWCFSGDGQTGQIVGDRDGFRPAHETAHLRAWQHFMADHNPKGYELEEDYEAEHSERWFFRTCEDGQGSEKGYPDKAAARAAAWQDYLDADADAVLDTLMLIAELWPEPPIPAATTGDEQLAAIAATDALLAARVAWIRGWSLLERGQAVLWAITEHLYASDHDDIERHPRPAHLDTGRPA